MRSEQHGGGVGGAVQLSQRITDGLCHRFDEPRMVEPHPQFFDRRRSGADLFLRRQDVLAVLPTTAVAAEHAGEKGERTFSTVVTHLSQRVGKQRVPIAVPPIDRQIDPVCGELVFQRRQQLPVLFVDRTDTAKTLVVFRHLHHPLAGDIFPAQNVFQEGDDVFGALGAAEGHQQKRVVGQFLFSH